MQLRLTKLHEEGRDFLVRVCMYVEDASWVVEGSVVRQCEECGRDVWYHEPQAIPVVLGTTIEAEVILCLPCMVLHQALDAEPPKWILPNGQIV
jgi:hypothetical protein